MTASFTRYLTVALVSSALIIASSSAQTMRDRGFEPVDQVVEDVDPLSRSLREREAGLRETGQFNTVYRPTDPDRSDRYFHISQGVTAEYGGRSLYSLHEDSGSSRSVLLQDIPPDTVFHIGTPRGDADEPTRKFDPPRSFVDGRARSAERVEGRSRQRTETRDRDDNTSPRAARAAQRRADWQRFNEQALAQRRVLSGLLDPADEPRRDE